MSMDAVNGLGLAAGALTTAAFVPQVVRTWRTRSTDDISLSMFVLFCAGVLLWCVYGVAVRSWPIVIANTVTLALAGVILLLKLRQRK